jgi:hypothetical protein
VQKTWKPQNAWWKNLVVLLVLTAAAFSMAVVHLTYWAN